MTIRDWAELTALIIITITSIARWVEAREWKEKQTTTEVGATRGDLADFEKRHTEEHAKLWREIERNRDHWHTELVPKLQSIFERIAGVEGAQRSTEQELRRVQTIIDRRRGARD